MYPCSGLVPEAMPIEVEDIFDVTAGVYQSEARKTIQSLIFQANGNDNRLWIIALYLFFG